MPAIETVSLIFFGFGAALGAEATTEQSLERGYLTAPIAHIAAVTHGREPPPY